MKLKFYLLVIVSILAVNIKAQVTIGSVDAPEKGAALELKNDKLGFLPTRVDLVSLRLPDPLPIHVEGMIVYNKTVSEKDTLQTGYYYNNGERWLRFTASSFFTENWFYMPSIVFETGDLSMLDKIQTKDLYKEFQLQINDAGYKGLVSSEGAPKPPLSYVPSKTDLYYYVTDYDKDVFEILSIDKSGLMTFKIIAPAKDDTFINIVFVEK